MNLPFLPFLPFLPVLHGLRGLAALGVLLFHWASIFPACAQALAAVQWGPQPWMNLSLPLVSGWQGVPLFFVLSAYLLTRQWQGRVMDGASLAVFWRRRLLRIYPAFWLQLLLLVLLARVVDGLLPAYGLQDLVLNALLWVNLPPAMAAPLNGVWWTLPVELMFYAVLPALVAAQRRLDWGVVVGLCLAVTVGWRLWVLAAYPGQNLAPLLHIVDALPGSLSTFAAGFAAAHLCWQPQGWHRAVGLGLVVLAFCGLQVALWTHDAVYLRGHWILAVWVPGLAAVLGVGLHLAIHSPALGAWLGGRVLVWLGQVSFGMYLWHYPVLLLLKQLGPRLGESPATSLLALGLAVPVTLALAELSFRFVESPAMRWGSARRGPPSATARLPSGSRRSARGRPQQRTPPRPLLGPAGTPSACCR